MGMYTKFIEAMIEADKEIGFIDVKADKKVKPDRISLGAEYNIPPVIVGHINKNTQNGQRFYYGRGKKAFRLYYPKQVFLRALELCRYEVPFKI